MSRPFVRRIVSLQPLWLNQLQVVPDLVHLHLAVTVVVAVHNYVCVDSSLIFCVDFWLGPLQAFSLQMSSGAESLQKYAKEETLMRLEALREDFTQKSKSIRDRLGKCQRSFGREQEGLLKVMREHEKLWTLRLEKTATQALAEAAGSSGTSEATEQKDVWLSELHLHGQIESFLEEKRKYCRILGEIYSETRVLNSDCSRRLAEVIAEHFTVKSKHLLAQTELMKDVTRGIEAVEPESEWQSALVRARLDYEWKLEAPPIDGFTQSVLQQISCAIYGSVQPNTDRSTPASPLARAPSSSVSVRPVKIVKAGYLMRPGATFGPAWQVLFCVLTDSHHLHLFHPETKKKSRSAKSAAGASPEQPYHVPSADDQLSQRHLADLNAAISTAWLGFMSRPGASPDEWLRIDNRLLEPALSVPLFEGVSVAVESPNEHIFSIQVPGSGSFFGRSDRKHQMKSFLEEDMVDWCIALKDQIAACQAAPTTFFHQTKEQQQHQQQHVAHPTWTSKEAVSNEIEEDWSPSAADAFEEDSSEPDLSGLSGLSLGSRSIETQPKPVTASTTPGPTFNLENPWG